MSQQAKSVPKETPKSPAEKEAPTKQPQTQEANAAGGPERSQHAPMEGVLSQAPLPDTMSAVGCWLKELAQADQNPEPIPHNSPLPSPRASSIQAMQRAARKEANISKDGGGASIPPPVTQLPPMHSQGGPSSEVKVRPAESGEKLPSAARPSTANRVGASAGTTRPSAKGGAVTGAVGPNVASAIAAGTSSMLPSKSVIDAQVQGLLMCPGWSSITAASREVLLSTYSVDPFNSPLDFQQEQGTLGALTLTASIKPPYSPSVHWALTEGKAKSDLAKVAATKSGGAVGSLSVKERVANNRKLFAVSAGCR